MLSEARFEIKILTDETGCTRIKVTHRQTRLSESAVIGSATAAELKQRLREMIFAKLCPNPNDIGVDIGRCSDDQFIQVTHLPTREKETQIGAETSAAQEELLETLLTRLWLRSAKTRA